MARRRSIIAPASSPGGVPAAGAPERSVLAPWPQNDRFPTVLGSTLTLQTISAILRLATTGYRREYVDLLDELLERDPHAYSALSQRILAVAGGRIDVVPAELPMGDGREERAKEIADFVRRCILGLPDLKQSLAGLLWAIYYGPCGSEIQWTRGDGWRPVRLHFLHSRRISYPDPFSWSPRIWDQGAVLAWSNGASRADPIVNTFGLQVSDFPGKFVIHAPQLRGDYPTRDGLGRELVWWMALKGMAARGGSQYVERFGKPWASATFTTGEKQEGPRTATDKDVLTAEAAVKALGIGSLASAVLPDSVELKLTTPSGDAKGMTHADMIALCDDQMSKAVRGSTYTSSPGKTGARSASEVAERGELRTSRYDADCLCDTLRRDLVTWIVRLNFPDDADLIPSLVIHVEESPGPEQIMTLAERGARIGMPLDAADIAERTGLRLVKEGDPKARRLAPLSPSPIAALEPGATLPTEPPADAHDPKPDGEPPAGEPPEDSDPAAED